MSVYLNIAAILSIFIYFFLIHSYILRNKLKNKKFHLLVVISIVNFMWVFILVLAQNSGLSIPQLYILTTIFLFVDLSSMTDISWRRLIFDTCFFSIHYILVHFISISALSFINQVPFSTIISSSTLLPLSIIMSVVILIVMLIMFTKFKFIKDISRVSEAQNYSEMVSVAALILCFNSIYDMSYFNSDKYIDGQFIVNVSSTMMTFTLFYFLIIYTVKFVNMNMYRRKTDELRDVYRHTVAKRAIMESQMLLDELTGLYNRKFIFETMERLCFECGSRTTGFVIMYIDANGLKYVNDNFGHNVGDRYLQSVACALNSSIRGQDFAARIGGDEFIVLIENIQPKYISLVEQRIHEAINIQNELEPDFHMSVSIGSIYVDYNLAQKGWSNLLEIADNMMREKKDDFYNRNRKEATKCLSH